MSGEFRSEKKGERLHGFPPAADAHARVLILGSMPSEASLAANAYYAHPRNRFWPVMGALLGFDPLLPYEERLKALKANGIALWDTIESCERAGSLDSAIENQKPNDLGTFLNAHPLVTLVCLNGAMSAGMWQRYGAPQLDALRKEKLQTMKMPSTSPANARWRLDDLVRVWSEAILPHLSARFH